MAVGVDLGLLRVSTPDEVSKEAESRRRAEVQTEQNLPIITELANHVGTRWQNAKLNRARKFDNILLKCLRQRDGEYDPEDKKYIKEHGSDIYMMLTNIKCRGAEAWLNAVELPPGEKPWGIEPTPIPDLPEEDEGEVAKRLYEEVSYMAKVLGTEATDAELTPEVIRKRAGMIQDEIMSERLEEALKETQKEEKRLEDELRQGEFYAELKKVIKDLVTFPVAYMKGPVVHADRSLQWVQAGAGIKTPKVMTTYRRKWKRVSPFDIYLTSGARTVQDGDLIEKQMLSRSELYDCIGADGFNENTIRQVLVEYDEGYVKEWAGVDSQRAEAEGQDNISNNPTGPLEALEFWGKVQGHKLIKWGIDESMVPDPEKEYHATVLMIGRYVVMARLNKHPLGKRPYYSASYEESADSILKGKGVPQLMRDCQKICNASARALVNNMGIASGPMIEVFMDRVQPGEDVEDLYPWKVFKTTSDVMGQGKPAVNFFQPDPLAAMLLEVYDFFFKQASEQSGVPAHVYGSADIGGAGRTASGLAMLMNAASKVLTDVVTHVDAGIVVPIITNLWTDMMLNDDVPKGGDINVIARASEYLIMQEQIAIRRNEFLVNTNNPIDMSIIGIPGRAAILREQAKGLKLGERIVPPANEVKQFQPPAPEAAGAKKTSPGEGAAPEGQPRI